MRNLCCPAIVILFVVFSCVSIYGKESLPPASPLAPASEQEKQVAETMEMLDSLVEIQSNLEQELKAMKKKITASKTEAEKSNLQNELDLLDRQLSETRYDFERIATGVEIGIFAEKKAKKFSWNEEFGILINPAVKELKRLTVRTRKKTMLKDTISRYDNLIPVAHEAVLHLESLINSSDNPQMKAKIRKLQPEWQNAEDRIKHKLELAKLELDQLEEQEISLSDSLSISAREFFRARGFYLIGGILTFITILLLFKIAYRVIFNFLPGAKEKQLSFHVRLLELLFRGSSIIFAVFCSFFVLYLAEDWFLLSMAIIFLLGLAWTIRLGIPKLWDEARLILNVGPIREGERVILYGVPWKVEKIHIFCKLFNPSLEVRLRIPIEKMIGKISRASKIGEPWFPCKAGDWVVVGDMPRGKVVSLSHDAVELVEQGGKRTTYRTQDFLELSPINLSRNFRLRIPFGITYNLQSQSTTSIPDILKSYIEKKLEESDYGKKCFNLSVEFMQAGDSSLDLMILADFKGELAEIYSRVERTIQQWCVEACTENGWEIPFTQLTFHWPEKEKLLNQSLEKGFKS